MSLVIGDLRNLVMPTLHVDEYESKLGDDNDVVTISFKVKYYDPAYELVNFIEKGYDWVLDADTSSGEMEDGSYLVFIEALRRPSLGKNLYAMLEELVGVTTIEMDQWVFRPQMSDEYYQFEPEMFLGID